MKKSATDPIIVLLVEDNEGDARLAIEVLKDGSIPNRLHHVRDGVEAMTFLNQEGEFSDAPRPDIILLDLNMPRMDGREVLDSISQNSDICDIPIIVLTTSQSENDIVKSYDLNANCFITKPVDLDQFVSVVRAIEQYWFTIVSLPSTETV